MGKRGPKPTPTNILNARGSWRGKTRPKEPKSDPVLLDPPDWLSPNAMGHWDSLATLVFNMRVSTPMDRDALALTADALARYVEARSEGEAKQAKDAWDQAMKGLKEFGCTPSSRTGVYATPDKDGQVIDGVRKFMRR